MCSAATLRTKPYDACLGRRASQEAHNMHSLARVARLCRAVARPGAALGVSVAAVALAPAPGKSPCGKKQDPSSATGLPGEQPGGRAGGRALPRTRTDDARRKPRTDNSAFPRLDVPGSFSVLRHHVPSCLILRSFSRSPFLRFAFSVSLLLCVLLRFASTQFECCVFACGV